MARCIVELNNTQKALLRGDLALSEFAFELSDYYQGKSEDYPDISVLAHFLNDEIIPSYFRGYEYNPEQLVSFLNDSRNVAKLTEAIGSMLGSIDMSNPKGLDEPPYSLDPGLILKGLREDAQNRVNAPKVNQDIVDNTQAEVDSSSQGLLDMSQYKHQFLKNYGSIQAYRAGRFKGSATTEIHVISKFINDVLLKNVLINTDTKELVSQHQIPGKFGKEGSAIDFNLKQYRKQLMQDLASRIKLNEIDSKLAKQADFDRGDAFYPENFVDHLKGIEQAVNIVKYKGENILLSDEGRLVEISNELKRTNDPELKKIVDNYVDYVILADFNKMFDYYGDGIINVSDYNDDFDDSSRKYNIAKVQSLDAINVQFKERIHNAIELSPELYKNIIEVTPMLSYTTGQPLNDYLYPALVSEIMAKYESKINPKLGAKGIKKVLIDALNDRNNSFLQKNVMYTMYKKFFEETGDKLNLPPKNSNKNVSSFLDTISRYSDKSLMQLVVKPLQETKKVFYAEATEINRQPAINQSGTKQFTASNINALNDVTMAINKSSREAFKNLFDKYSINFLQGKITYKAPGTEMSYDLLPVGNSSYDRDVMVGLSKELVGIDFLENNAHKELLQDLESRSNSGDQLPDQYLSFMYDALKTAQAKDMLFDPEVQKKIKDKGIKADIKGSDVLLAALEKEGFNTDNPADNILEVHTPASEAMYEMMAQTENRYAGNRYRSTVVTPEGTMAAGFSTHTLFLGLGQTHNDIRTAINSVEGNDDSRSPLKNLATIVDPNWLVRFEVRAATKIGANVKPNSEMTNLETMIYNINLGYYDRMVRALAGNRSVSPMFDIMTYSDKTTNYMAVINNKYAKGNQSIFVEGGQAVAEDVTRKLHFDTVGSYYRAQAQLILDTWRKVYGAVQLPTDRPGDTALDLFDNALKGLTKPSEKLAKVNELNSVFWKKEGFAHGLTGFRAARHYANESGVVLNNWIHYQNNAKTIQSDSIPIMTKPALIDYIRLFDDPNKRGDYDRYMNKKMVSAVNDLMDIGYDFDGQTSKNIAKIYTNLGSAFQTADGLMRLTAGGRRPKEAKDINPAFRKYINDFNFAAENITLSSVGSPYAHKGTTAFNTWVTQNKRNVMATASMRKYTLGLEDGVEDYTTTAFIDDFETPLKTILGDIHKVVDMDGASLETYTQRLKTYNSLNAKFAGDGGPDHKSIFSHIDPQTGETGLTKHAAFVMDNIAIRNSIGNDVDLMELHKKLYGTDISKIDITKTYRKDINLSHFQNEPVYYWDRTFDYDKNQAGQIYKLESIEYQGVDPQTRESVYTIKKVNMSLDPNTVLQENNVRIKTMYDLWRVLGHIDSVELSETPTAISLKNGSSTMHFKPSHTAAEKLLQYESYYGLGNERILPSSSINASSNSDVKAWNIYKQLFNSPGIVNSHISLIRDFAAMDPQKFETQKQLNDLLDRYDAKVNAPEFLKLLHTKDNAKVLETFFKKIVDKKAAAKGEIAFDAEKDRPYQRLKGKNIDRLSFAGAQKLGQFNMNDNSVLSKRRLAEIHRTTPLLAIDGVPGIHTIITHGIANLNGGVQLNAWHDASESTVTAPTQMLNALIFNGKSIEDVSDIYQAIGDIVDTNLTYALSDPDIHGPQKINIPQMVRGLSNAQFYAQNKDTLLRVFHDMMKQSVKDNDFTLETVIKNTFTHANLPIDDPHLFNSAVADLANYFTKNGIRIDFDGIFSVLAPSSGILQFHDVKGGFLPIHEGNGAIGYRKLDPNRITTLNSDDFKRWSDYDQHLAANPNKLAEGESRGVVINQQPRDLKGQQITLEYPDGRVHDLSVLRRGEQHIIPEAEALASVKSLIADYTKLIKGSTYEGLTDQEKIESIADSYDAFKIAFDELINDKSKNFSNKVAYVHDALIKDYTYIDPTYSGHIVDFINDKFGLTDFRNRMNGKYADDPKKLVQSHEYDYLNKVNQIGRAYLGKLQDFLDTASLGVIPGSLTRPDLLRTVAHGDDAAFNAWHEDFSRDIHTAKIKVSRGEVVAPLTAKKAFLLREGDSIGDVDEAFFLKRLHEKLDYYDVNAHGLLVSKYGRRIFLHQGRMPKTVIPTEFTKEIGDKVWYTDESGNPQFVIPNGVQLSNQGGYIHAYSTKQNFGDILKASLNSAYREDGDKFSIKDLGANAEQKAALKASDLQDAQTQAKTMWNSWQKYLEVIGTRIPGQHFQSFQGLKIVGFTEGNKIYVPNEVTLLSGSDFDIDKQNVIYHSINKDGTIALWHPASRLETREDIEKSLKLPLQARRQKEAFLVRTHNDQPIDRLSRLDDSIDMTDLDVLLDVYQRLKNGERFSAEVHPNIIESLVKYDNWTGGKINEADPYGIDVTALNNGVKGIKNFAVSRTNSTIENAANFIFLSKPVAMDVPALFADNSPKGEAAKNADPHKPTSIAFAKLDNMVGKKVIGIMATGLKVFSALSLTYNNQLRNLAGLVNESNRLFKTVSETSEIGPDDQSNAELTRVNSLIAKQFASLDTGNLGIHRIGLADEARKLAKGSNELLVNVNYDKISSDVLHKYYEGRRTLNPEPINNILDRIANPENPADALVLKKYLQVRGTFEDDAAEIMSQLLSAATDNAKELILGKINASPDLAGAYATMIMLGMPFEQIVDTMTSATTEMLLRNGSKNVFDKNTSNNSIANLLANVNTWATTEQEGTKAVMKKILNSKYNLSISPRGVKDNITGKTFPLSELLDMHTILTTGTEVSLLGRMLSINQGVKSNTWDLYKFKSSIENYVRKTTQSKFDFKLFLDSLGGDKVYANDYISQLDGKRASFNILYVLATNPHFAEQLKAYNAAHTILGLSSYKVNATNMIIEKLKSMNFMNDTVSVNENQFRDIEKFVENSIIENFIDQETDRNQDPRSAPIFYDGERKMKLTSPEEREEFANWVRDKFVPSIKDNPAYRGNDFIQGITVDTKNDALLNDKYSFVKLKVDTTNAQSLIQQGHKESYVYGLKSLYKDNATDLQSSSRQNDIVNTLFWYNLILNKNSITKNSYAKMLGEVMGLDSTRDNPYRRLLEFKGNIGKNERTHDIDFNQSLIMANGVTLDIVDLLKYYDSFGDIERKAGSRRLGEDELIAEEGVEDLEGVEEGEIDNELPEQEEDSAVDDGSGDIIDDFDAFQDEEGEGQRPAKVTVNKVKIAGQTGTKVTIKYGDAVRFDGMITSASSLIPHGSEVRSKFTFHTDYNPLDNKRDALSDKDAINYQKMLHLTMHDLLSNLAEKLDIQIIQQDGNSEPKVSKFDPTQTYDCL